MEMRSRTGNSYWGLFSSSPCYHLYTRVCYLLAGEMKTVSVLNSELTVLQTYTVEAAILFWINGGTLTGKYFNEIQCSDGFGH